MSQNDQQYKMGDVANGHVLTEQGWVPLAAVPAGAPKKKSRKGLKITGGILGALFLIGILMPSEDSGTTAVADDTPAVTASEEPTVEETVEEEPVVEETVEEPVVEETPAEEAATKSQRNALGAAENYLDTMPFSKAGLIDQLSSEYGSGFPKADAKWAVEQLDVDWNEQAVRAAEDYLDTMPFSRQGLIDQLSSEYGSQFTKKQAIYAANKVGL